MFTNDYHCHAAKPQMAVARAHTQILVETSKHAPPHHGHLVNDQVVLLAATTDEAAFSYSWTTTIGHDSSCTHKPSFSTQDPIGYLATTAGSILLRHGKCN